MTQEERLIVSAYTGVTMTDFDKIQEYISKVLGRPIFTHELASETIQAEIKEAVKDKFLALCG